MSARMAGVWNTLFGAALLFGGATGRWVVFGTNQGVTLAVGGVMAAWGISQLVRSRKG